MTKVLESLSNTGLAVTDGGVPSFLESRIFPGLAGRYGGEVQCEFSMGVRTFISVVLILTS